VGFVGLLIVASALAAAPSQAAFPGQNGDIAFEKSLRPIPFGLNPEIFTMPEAGQPQTNRSNDDGIEFQPAVSADGKKIAFVSYRSTGNEDIHTMNADGTGVTRLTTNPQTAGVSDAAPAFSRDGKRIVFVSRRDENAEIYAMDAVDADGDGNGDNLVRLTASPTDEAHPVFLPSGSRIAFNGGSTGRELFTINADGTGQKLLAPDALSPDFSPDAKKIAFAKAPAVGDPRDIFTMNADGSGEINLTKTPGLSDTEPVFSPDGAKIAYNSAAFDQEIYTMNADGSLPVNRSVDPNVSDSGPSWGVKEGTAAVPVSTTSQCSDGADNDADGNVDHPADPGCTSPGDDSEDADPDGGPSLPQCSDGKDNDADAKVDHPADPGCDSPEDGSESPDPMKADLQLTQTDATDPAVLYSDLTYKITVHNKGPAAAKEVNVVDNLPDDASFVAARCEGGSCGGQDDSAGGFLGTIEAGTSRTVTVVVRPRAPGVFVNTASVHQNEEFPDPELSDNAASETTQVNTGPPSLWSDTGDLTHARLYGHTTTLLKNGQVLVTGGGGIEQKPLASAELYDPKTGTWTPTGSLKVARMDHSAILLDDGRVVVVGGSDGRPHPDLLSSIEVYDPLTKVWSPGGTTIYPRAGMTATPLGGMRVLLTGGDGPGNQQAEIYDAAKGGTTLTGPLIEDRLGHTATTLGGSGCADRCGRVLVIGGRQDGADDPPGPELYDPALLLWTPTDAEEHQRVLGHTATLLATGKVLVAGGHRRKTQSPNVLATAELYDPVSGMFTATGALAAPRQGHAAIRLPSGKLLVTGGRTSAQSAFGRDHENGTPQSSAELFDPASGTWSATGPMMRARARPTGFFNYTYHSLHLELSQNTLSATLLTGGEAVCGANCGKVLVVGGSREKTAELYSETLSAGTGPDTGTSPPATGTDTTQPDAGTAAPGSATPDPGAGTSDPGTSTDQPPAGAAVATTSGTGAAQVSPPGPAGSDGRSPTGTALSGSDRARAKAMRTCLQGVARRYSSRSRSKTLSVLRRANSLRRTEQARCVRLHGRTPGRVEGLTARARSATRIELSFRAPGTDGARAPAARGYLVGQSTRPMAGEEALKRALPLCKGTCRFARSRPGEPVTLTVEDLKPKTTYYYVVAARDNVSGRLGPRSEVVKVRTR